MASKKKSFGTLLLLLAFAKAASSSSDDFVDQMDVASQAENPRWARAANSSFDEFVDQMTAASQVFAGISLESGFLDDSIPSDAALAELLNLKNADLAKIERFDNKSVPAFFTKLTNSDLAENELEKAFLTMNSWISENKKWKDPLDLTPPNNYLNKLEVHKKSIVFGLYDTAAGAISELIPLLEKFRKIPDVPTGDVFQYTVDLRELKKKLEEIEKKPDLLNIQNFLDINNDKLGEYGHFEVFGLIKFSQEMSIIVRNPAFVPDFFKSIQSASSLSSELTAASLIFVELLNIFESFGSDIDRIHTSGLAGGFRDLKIIQASAKNPVFSSLIDSYDWNTVEKGLSPLIPLAKNCESLHNQWISAHNLNSTETIKTLIEVQQKFVSLQKVIQLGEDNVSEVLKVREPGYVNFAKARPVAHSFRTLKEKMDPVFHTIKEFVESKSFQNPSRLSELNNKMKFSVANGLPTSELQGVLTSMRTFTEIDEMIQSLKNQVKLYSKLNIAMKGFSLNTSLQEVVNNKVNLENFVSDSITQDFVRYLNDLKKLPNLEKIAEAVTTVQLLRTIKSAQNNVDNVLKASNIVALSSREVKVLRSTPNSIKQSTVPEVQSMLNLKGLLDQTKVFGKAAEGLNILKIAIGKEKSFNVVVNFGKEFEDLMKLLSDVSLQMDYRGKLEDMKTFKNKVKEVKDALDARKNSLNSRKRSATDFGQKFSKLGGLSDYDFDFATALKFIEDTKASTSEWIEFKDALVELSSLDLHFAKHNAPFSAMPKVFTDIFKLFGEAAKKPVPPPPSGDPSDPAAAGGGAQGSATTSRSWVDQSRGSSDGSGGIATTEEPGTAWWMYLIYALGTVAVLVGLILLIRCCCLKEQNRENEEQLREDKQRLLKERNDANAENEKLKDQNRINNWIIARLQGNLQKRAEKDHQGKKAAKKVKTKEDDEEMTMATLKSSYHIAHGVDKELLLVRRKIENNRNCGVTPGELTAEQKAKYDKVLNEAAKAEFCKTRTKAELFDGAREFRTCPKELVTVISLVNEPKVPTAEMAAEKTLTETAFLHPLIKIKESMDMLMKNVNMTKNVQLCRNKEIICYDYTRVTFQKLPGANNYHGQFINANFQIMPYGVGIITQLPIPETNNNELFWAMTYYAGARKMVFIDHEGNDYYNYPKTINEIAHYGQTGVKAISIYDSPHYVSRKFHVLVMGESVINEVELLEFKGWKTGKLPRVESLDTFMQIVKEAVNANPTIPIVYDLDGGYKAACLLGIAYCYQTVHLKGVSSESFDCMIKSILGARGNTLNSAEQVWFIKDMTIMMLLRDFALHTELPKEILEPKWYDISKIDDKVWDAKLREKYHALPLDDTQKSEVEEDGGQKTKKV